MQQAASAEALAGELERLRPAELLLAEDYKPPLPASLLRGITRRPAWQFELDSATALADPAVRHPRSGRLRLR